MSTPTPAVATTTTTTPPPPPPPQTMSTGTMVALGVGLLFLFLIFYFYVKKVYIPLLQFASKSGSAWSVFWTAWPFPINLVGKYGGFSQIA